MRVRKEIASLIRQIRREAKLVNFKKKKKKKKDVISLRGVV